MEKTNGRPMAYLTDDGKFLCCFYGIYIFLDSNWKYSSVKYEIENLSPVNKKAWDLAKKWGRKPFKLTEEQIIKVQYAFIERQKLFEQKEVTFNFISQEDIDSLSRLIPEVMFLRIIFWCKHFVCTPESQGFRDRIGFKIFGAPNFFIERLNPTQKDEVVKAYGVLNPKPSLELCVYISKVNTKQPSHKWKE